MIEPQVTRYRRTKRWRGKRMVIHHWRTAWFITIPAQKYAYFSTVADPTDFASP